MGDDYNQICNPAQMFGGGGSFRSGMQSPTGALGALEGRPEVGAGIEGAKQSFAGRIPKQSLGTTR